MERSFFSTGLVCKPTLNRVCRVLVCICFSAGILATKCFADDEVPFQTELSDHAAELKTHFCSCPPPVPSDHSLCSEFCSFPKIMNCFTNDEDSLDDKPCLEHSQTFVCGYIDAVVCAGDMELCVYKPIPGGKSFCICNTDSTPRTVLDGSCKNSPQLLIGILVGLFCLLVIILVVILVCVFWLRRRMHFQNNSKGAASRGKSDSKDNDPEGHAHGYEQPVPIRQEYSYAYAHPSRAPVNSQTGEPDLDDEQEDHYYSHLKQDGSEKRSPEIDQKDNLKNKEDGQETPIEHEYLMPAKPSKGEDSVHGANEGKHVPPFLKEGDKIQHTYFKVHPKLDRQINSSGNEVAGVQEPGDVIPKASSQNDEDHSYISMQPIGEPHTQSNDSGYEVATVKSPEDTRRSYVTLEPPTGNKSSEMDSGYEVARVNDLSEQDDYDHLERNEHLALNEGAIPKYKTMRS